MAYVVIASRGGREPVRYTRLQRVSAAVLAMKLTEEGCDNVAIMEGLGARLNIVEFRPSTCPSLSGLGSGRRGRGDVR